jgi:hypothetical protein
MNRFFVTRLLGVWFVILLLMGVGVFGLQVPAGAFNSHITEDPTRILQKYLSLDQKGVRLNVASFEVMDPYIVWQDEPAWGHVVVIANFQIESDATKWEIIDGLDAKIPVTFDVLGTMHWESVTFVPDSHQETHWFHIKAVYDRWQIAGPILPPHVGRRRLVDFVRWTELNEPDVKKKTWLASLQKQLNAKK